ncbi:phosphoribosyltransferase family protein [Williamsia sp. CHRR-6]|nr:phosphoribosyltransferase family protein [Williamsia sp. CHRR-6]
MGLRAVPVGGAGWSTDELIVPGLRRNPRRAHLWVSTVLGKHIPVPASRIIAAGTDLAAVVAQCLQPRPASDCVVFGFAETATGLGHVVAHALNASVYLHSTRRVSPPAPTAAVFQEGHSHATDHLIQPTSVQLLTDRCPIVLVDDEISTGATALDAIANLHAFAPRDHYVVASLVDLRSAADRERCAKAAAALGVRVDFVALAIGIAEVPADLVARVGALPETAPSSSHRRDTPGAGEVVKLMADWPTDLPDGGRHGVLAGERDRFDAAVIAVTEVLAVHLAAGRPVLVLGHEEFMYLPMRVAAELERRGDWPSVTTQTTTRSPAYVCDEPDYPLRHGVSFIGPEVLAGSDTAVRYLYNAAIEAPQVQRVLMVDGPADTDALVADDSVVAALTDSGRDLLLVVVGGTGHGGTDFAALCAARRQRGDRP